MINKGYLTAKINNESDEYYTPDYVVEHILKFLKMNPNFITVWCPFDKEDSPFVKILKQNNYDVIFSHIDDNKNFFHYQPEREFDCIISNPPFSMKDLILKRLSELDKPYAMLMPLNVLQGQKRFEYIKYCQALVFDKRINFLKEVNGQMIMQKGVSFASIYLCKNFLPSDLIFEKL